ncbi:glycosyltransferase [Cyanobium sp. ATX 6F1]|uniref:glycosyltransferase n=1 Tax=unclassified Cyanobium TaxID=2627006 RepID=UPI0020CFB97C|nr:glycosyltransferase [Cyanobium sp. ATX 6F1]MCP9915847.1 glycosyltransferase family 2 protein [Cyanobium sp. ATX 6F1]
MAMKPLAVSVVIPTHNPHPLRFGQVLKALRQQTLPLEQWELVIVDNASSTPIELSADQANDQPFLKLIREPRLGLTTARWRGISEASAGLIVLVDDDNVLDPSYLEEVCRAFDRCPKLGAAGGKALPAYEVSPPPWFEEGAAPLGCRDLGNEEQIMDGSHYARQPAYPPFAPIGAGMALRRSAVDSWLATALESPVTDRRGNSLSSAGDCDLVLHVLESGWSVGYVPSLSLTHLMAAGRVDPGYLEAISRAAYRDFIRVLDLHGLRPWSAIPGWSIPLRALKAWFSYRVWSGPRERLRWQSAIGQYEGRASLLRR